MPENQVPAASSVHEFGPFRLESTERLLLRAGQPVSLTPKAFDLLVYLIGHAGRLVTKQALMSALWPDSFVEDTNLTFTVSALRKALGDGQDGEQFIQTVPTRGYRFVAPVTSIQDQPVSSTGKPAHTLASLIRQVAIGALAVSVIAMLPLVVRHLRERRDTPAPVTFTIPMPESTLIDAPRPMSQVSPDGRRVALVVSIGARIWLRDIDSLKSFPVAGTEGARALFWSPDSEQIAFGTESQLKTVRVSDGMIRTLCESCQPRGGGTWSRKGTIVFTTRDGSLLGIPATGGAPLPVTRLDRSRQETAHLFPYFLPDGVRFLYVNRNEEATRSGLFVGQIGSLKSESLLAGDLPAIYANGYLLFLRSGALMAQRFDQSGLTFSGDANPLVSSASADPLVSQVAFSASETGVLTYSIVERPITQFQWVSRAGELLQLVGEPGPYYTFDLSADGSRLVFAQWESGDARLRSLDLRLSATKNLTFGASHADPRWTKAGGLVATKWRPLPQTLVQISPDGESNIPVPGDGNMVEDVSRDGSYLLYRQTGRQLWAMSLSKGSTPVLVRKAPAGGINQAQFSPDNQWIAYHANESGRFEVYVTRFSPTGPPTGEHWPVSSGGGLQPVWRQDGQELYYLEPDGTLNAVGVRPGNPPVFSSRKQLFQTGLRPNENVEQYSADADGQRFLLLKVVDDRNRSSVGVILGWPALLATAESR